MSDRYENAVFVSYAWGGDSEKTVDDLEQALAENGIRMVRDKKDLGYKGSIQDFEQRIGQGQCVVLVISDKYLRSEHCMYELVEVEENRTLRQRIFPIVLGDARIFKALDRLDYIQYWDQQIVALNEKIKQVGMIANLRGITDDLDKYARIRANFDHLTDLLSDMNTLTPEIMARSGYQPLVGAVKNLLAQPNPQATARTNSEHPNTAFTNSGPANAAPTNTIHVPAQQPAGPQTNIQIGNITSSGGGAVNVAGGNITQTSTVIHNSGVDPEAIARAFATVKARVENLENEGDKEDAQDALKKLETEAKKGEQPDPGRVRKWLDFLLEMSGDIGEVALATFSSPISGLSTAFRKIVEKAKEEKEAKA